MFGLALSIVLRTGAKAGGALLAACGTGHSCPLASVSAVLFEACFHCTEMGACSGAQRATLHYPAGVPHPLDAGDSYIFMFASNFPGLIWVECMIGDDW